MPASPTHVEPAIAAISSLRAEGARVHCITNSVAQNFTANVLLACGASPSMTASRDEAPQFTERLDALLINLGTLDAERRIAIRACADIAARRGIPIVLDPVKCDLSPPRLAFAAQLLSAGNLILKANRAEAQLLGEAPAALRIVTGQIDTVSAPSGETATVSNGHPLMDRTVAMGCALGALVAALCVRARSPFDGALAALLWFGVAGEVAAEKAGGPGSFATRFLDALYATSPETIRKQAGIA